MENYQRSEIHNVTQTKRINQVDLLKGILIILVVFAHYKENTAHYIIFLFHMPLFFVISGFLMSREKASGLDYFYKRAKALMIPYVCYFLLEWISKRDFSVKSIIKLVWGGRSISWGVYWYITCLIAALFVFGVLLRKFSDRKTKCLILIGGALR